jgi:hypothetical protein
MRHPNVVSFLFTCLLLTGISTIGLAQQSIRISLDEQADHFLASPAQLATSVGLDESNYTGLTGAESKILMKEDPKVIKPRGKVRRPSIFDINRPDKHFNIKINMLDLASGIIQIMPEVRLTKTQSITFNVFFGKRTQSDVTYDVFSFAPELRQYIFKDARGVFHGGYLGGYLRYRNEQTNNNKYNQIGGGGVVGLQLIVKDFLTIDTFVGAGFYVFSEASGAKKTLDGAPGRGDIRFGVALGICPE